MSESETLKRRGRPTTGQAKTAAQRMQERRQRMRHGDTGDRDKGGEREITLTLSLSAMGALRRMAKRDDVTQKRFINDLLLEAESALLQGLSVMETASYFGEPNRPAQDASEAAPSTQPEEPEITTPDKSEEANNGAALTPRKQRDLPRGIFRKKRKGSWDGQTYEAQVRINGKPKSLGTFTDIEKAVAAINEAKNRSEKP